ncbi:hypothetical protein ACGF1Z_11775 [Streptomyces sp. NPDC048018]|uniref:hypothetical protein n=1 Tax=Streptomyces sp. NPDC048018 TaxID=3365499 RepID=UPI00371B5E1E
MRPAGHTTATPRAASARTLVLTLFLALLLAVTCGSGSPSAGAGPRTAAPPPRVLAAVPGPYETVPSNDGELTAATGRATAGRHGRRRTIPRRTAPGHPPLTELPPAPALPEPRPAADGGTRARRHHANDADAARTHTHAPSALQVFRR